MKQSVACQKWPLEKRTLCSFCSGGSRRLAARQSSKFCKFILIVPKTRMYRGNSITGVEKSSDQVI